MPHHEPTGHLPDAYMDIIKQLIYEYGAYMDRLGASMDMFDAYKYLR
jgi:hypothetical protein